MNCKTWLFHFFLALASSVSVAAQPADTLALLFIGDIMGHDSQLAAAYDSAAGTYDFREVFCYVEPRIRHNDFAIANLEVTLAGPPYKGYPRFSSPDELAVACRQSGINVLVTANNHAYDRGAAGLRRTIRVLDSLGIAHTGTFASPADRQAYNLLILEKNGIRVGLLNYTYGTNGLRPAPEVVINYIDTVQMKKDIAAARSRHLDKLVVYLHWGEQYRHQPNERQKNLAAFLLRQGAGLVIGSHPHVLQKMIFLPAEDPEEEVLVVYSLGNFVSNQRQTGRDGGAMVRVLLVKENGKTRIEKTGHHLVWVHKSVANGKLRFQVLPVSAFEHRPDFFADPDHYRNMQDFVRAARALLRDANTGVPEIK